MTPAIANEYWNMARYRPREPVGARLVARAVDTGPWTASARVNRSVETMTIPTIHAGTVGGATASRRLQAAHRIAAPANVRVRRCRDSRPTRIRVPTVTRTALPISATVANHLGPCRPTRIVVGRANASIKPLNANTTLIPVYERNVQSRSRSR